jgi:hypothetical protein
MKSIICYGCVAGAGNCVVDRKLVPINREKAATRNSAEALRYE